MSSEFEIFLEEQRRNTGGGRISIWRVWVKRAGFLRSYRDQTFPAKRQAVEKFNLYRRTLNAPASEPPPVP